MDAGCSVPSTSSGGGPGPEDDAAATSSGCEVSASDSLCNQCAYSDCCSFISACFATADYTNLSNCIAGCQDNLPCVGSCESTYPQGMGAYDAIGSCVTTKCAVCGEASVGDPCGAVSCVAPLSCDGRYCTKACARSSDCTGIGAGGGNVGGTNNVCVFVPSAGDTCVPECVAESDCTAFPGTYCESTTAIDGSPVQICAPLPDGGSP
jgi:hypothetical protein